LFVSQQSLKYVMTGGLLFYPGDSDTASLNPAMNAAMLMSRYAQMASTPDKKSRYLVRCRAIANAQAY
jgi:endoglucanase